MTHPLKPNVSRWLLLLLALATLFVGSVYPEDATDDTIQLLTETLTRAEAQGRIDQLLAELEVDAGREDLPTRLGPRLRYLHTLSRARDFVNRFRQIGQGRLEENRILLECDISMLEQSLGDQALAGDARLASEAKLHSLKERLAGLEATYSLPDAYFEQWARHAVPDRELDGYVRQAPADDRLALTALFGIHQYYWRFWTDPRYELEPIKEPVWLVESCDPLVEVPLTKLTVDLRRKIASWLSRLEEGAEKAYFAPATSRDQLIEWGLYWPPLDRIKFRAIMVQNTFLDELPEEDFPDPGQEPAPKAPPHPAPDGKSGLTGKGATSTQPLPSAPVPVVPIDGQRDDRVGLPQELADAISPCIVVIMTHRTAEAKELYSKALPRLRQWAADHADDPLSLAVLKMSWGMADDVFEGSALQETRDEIEATLLANRWGYAPICWSYRNGDLDHFFRLLDWYQAYRDRPAEDWIKVYYPYRSLADHFKVVRAGDPKEEGVYQDLGSLDAYRVIPKPKPLVLSQADVEAFVEREIRSRRRTMEMIAGAVLYYARNRPDRLVEALERFPTLPDLARAARLELSRHRLGVIDGDAADVLRERLEAQAEEAAAKETDQGPVEDGP